jgi:hypothetical protein
MEGVYVFPTNKRLYKATSLFPNFLDVCGESRTEGALIKVAKLQHKKWCIYGVHSATNYLDCFVLCFLLKFADTHLTVVSLPSRFLNKALKVSCKVCHHVMNSYMHFNPADF